MCPSACDAASGYNPLIFVFYRVAFHSSQPEKEAIPLKALVNSSVKLHSGDIVLRNGKGLISELFRNTSRLKKEYSHAGIILIEEKDTLVAHMMGDGLTSGLRTESLSSFCSSDKNISYAVYRYDLKPSQEQSITNFVHIIKASQIPFDDRFNLDSDSALYCTELIFKSLSTAGYKLQCSDLRGEKYLSIDDLYVRNKAELIFEHHY